LLGFEGKAKPQQGGGLLILCPAHEEKTPSCSVTVGPDGTVRACCFSCGFTGDALHLVALARKLNIRTNFRSVLFEAAALARTTMPSERPFTPSVRKPPVPLPKEKVHAVLQMLIAACPVAHDSQARAYLMSRPSGRMLLDEAERAGWGVFPKDRGGLKLAAQVLSKFGPEALTLADLRMSKSGPVPQHPAYRLLIPFRTPEGLLHTLQRRRLDGRAPKYLFPAGYRALWPYGAEAMGSMGPQTSVVYVEGAVDTLERTGKYRALGEDRLVLGLPGIATWRGEWATVCKGREARVALDTDRAGEAAVPRLVADLWQAGATAVHRTRPSDGRKDWNTATRNNLSPASRP
jgi:DNA primase